jgi:tRNA threonylcarbamoyladenosine biosynthesis protein TsaB
MRIVAIDTAAEHGSLALLEDGELIEELPLHSPEGFGQILFTQLQRLMERHGWRHETVAGYAAGAGPGSFTGVRIALAAAKGLAETAKAKAAAVSNLQAMASFGSGPRRAAFYDARRGEVYGGLFDQNLEPLSEEMVMPLPAWLKVVGSRGKVELITWSPEVFHVEATRAPRALAAALGRLALARLADPAAIDANYVRRSDAELYWKED